MSLELGFWDQILIDFILLEEAERSYQRALQLSAQYGDFPRRRTEMIEVSFTPLSERVMHLS